MDTNVFLISGAGASAITESGTNWLAVGAGATAVAASVAMLIFSTQVIFKIFTKREERSKFYLEHCIRAVERAMTLLETGPKNAEVISEVAMILAEVSKLECEIKRFDHQRTYTVHRQALIASHIACFNELEWHHLANLGADDRAFVTGGGYKGSIISMKSWLQRPSVGSRYFADHGALYFTEPLLSENELFCTPFPGVPMGRVLNLVRFFISKPSFSKVADTLTEHEKYELTHDRRFAPFKTYIDFCLNVEMNGANIMLREQPVVLEELTINPDSISNRCYVVREKTVAIQDEKEEEEEVLGDPLVAE